jgi:hypothetical protein
MWPVPLLVVPRNEAAAKAFDCTDTEVWKVESASISDKRPG